MEYIACLHYIEIAILKLHDKEAKIKIRPWSLLAPAIFFLDHVMFLLIPYNVVFILSAALFTLSSHTDASGIPGYCLCILLFLFQSFFRCTSILMKARWRTWKILVSNIQIQLPMNRIINWNNLLLQLPIAR